FFVLTGARDSGTVPLSLHDALPILQGLASGVTVRGGGQPGQEARIEIRGLKNLSQANPLYVIDGLVTTANRDFNPNDIESIQILDLKSTRLNSSHGKISYAVFCLKK